MSDKPFQYEDNDWDEFIERMEDISLDGEDSMDDEADLNWKRDEINGVFHFSTSEGEKASLPIDYVKKIGERIGNPCPICVKGYLGISFDFESPEILSLQCDMCESRFTISDGKFCHLNCDTGPDP